MRPRQLQSEQQILLRSIATMTARGKLAHEHHVASSDFSGDLILMSDLGRCSASGLLLEQEELDGDYTAPLLAVASASGSELPEPSLLAGATAGLTSLGLRPHKAWSRATTREGLLAVMADVPRRLLTPPRRYAFFLDFERSKLVGEIASSQP